MNIIHCSECNKLWDDCECTARPTKLGRLKDENGGGSQDPPAIKLVRFCLNCESDYDSCKCGDEDDVEPIAYDRANEEITAVKRRLKKMGYVKTERRNVVELL